MTHNLLTWKSGNNGGNSISLNANDQNSEMDLLKLDELIVKHPELESDLGWSKDEIISFFEGKLLLGEQKEENGVNQLYISEKSLERLIEYMRSLEDLKNKFKLPDDSNRF